ncbi:MAG: YARHG domain-containing protein [Sphaerochaetaceae bacterium]|nr:YARHG domain-containing protein [Sphaerochaetaceae bacterium]
MEMLTIENTYNYRPYYRDDSTTNRKYTIKYILKTGATWKNDIDEAIIRISIPENDNSYYFFDKRWGGRFRKFEVNTNSDPTNIYEEKGILFYEWIYHDLEPDFDIELSYEYSDWATYDDNFDNIPISFFVLERFLPKYFELNDKNILTNNASFFENLNDSNFLSEIYLPAIYEYIVNDGKSEITPENKLAVIRFSINCIYALNGYIFNTDMVRDLFNEFSWYEPLTKEPQIIGEELILLDKFKELRAELQNI